MALSIWSAWSMVLCFLWPLHLHWMLKSISQGKVTAARITWIEMGLSGSIQDNFVSSNSYYSEVQVPETPSRWRWGNHLWALWRVHDMIRNLIDCGKVIDGGKANSAYEDWNDLFNSFDENGVDFLIKKRGLGHPFQTLSGCSRAFGLTLAQALIGWYDKIGDSKYGRLKRR